MNTTLTVGQKVTYTGYKSLDPNRPLTLTAVVKEISTLGVTLILTESYYVGRKVMVRNSKIASFIK